MNLTDKNLSKKELSRLLAETDFPAIVKALEYASSEQKSKIFKQLPQERMQKVFIYLEQVTQAAIIQELDNTKAMAILEKMEPDDRARLFEELPTDIASRFLRRLSVKERRATSLLLKYPEETAGRIMSPFYLSLHADMSVEEALKKIRQAGAEAETIYMMPVVNDNMRLEGMVELEKLVMTKPDARIGDLMIKDIRSFSVHEDQEKVARYIQSTDWLAVAIVEEDQQLVGMVTIDDAMDIMQEEETEDIILGSASEPLGKPYLSVSVFRLVKSRVIWLFFLALAGTLTVNVLSAFEGTLDQGIVLALFIPLLVGIGGNTGSQSATTIVRALAMEHVRINDFLKIAARETIVGVFLGLSLGLAAYLVIWVIFQQNIAIIVGLSLIAICTMAALTGSLMPLLARSIGLDPAVVSTPFVSTIIDASGLLVYFTIATLILGSG